MKRRWTVLSAAAVFLAMAGVVLFAPTGFVLWAPGTATVVLSPDDSIVEVGGQPLHSTGGRIVATSLDQSGPSARVALPSLVAFYLMANHDVLPRDAVYSPGQTPAEATAAAAAAAQTAADDSLAAAVRQSGVEVTERPMIDTVWPNGASNQLLFQGDLVMDIDNVPMGTPNDIKQYLARKQVGDQVVVSVLRDGDSLKVTIPKLAGSSGDPSVPSLGVTTVTGYSFPVEVGLTTPGPADPSQGLATALAVSAAMTGTKMGPDSTVAAVGLLSAAGEVTGVAGINEHAASAAGAGADMLILPEANCADLTAHFPGLRVVPVTTLEQALSVLAGAGQGDPDLPRC